MSECLSDLDLSAFVSGSAPSAEMDRWNEHLDTCESCAARAVTAQAAATDAGSFAETAPHQHSNVLGPGQQLGDFRIEEKLGAGGMGVVFRARQVSLNRAWRVKEKREQVTATLVSKRLSDDAGGRRRACE